MLAEIEQGVTLAAQQLQLAANVQGAVLALQSAEVRLAGSNNPQFVALHKVILRDLDRLRALPQIDVTGMNGRLESVIAVVDSLPLTINGRPREESKPRELSDPSVEHGAGRFASPSGSAWRRISGARCAASCASSASIAKNRRCSRPVRPSSCARISSCASSTRAPCTARARSMDVPQRAQSWPSSG